MKWIKVDAGYVCSSCGYVNYKEDHFCPKCGLKADYNVSHKTLYDDNMLVFPGTAEEFLDMYKDSIGGIDYIPVDYLKSWLKHINED